MKVDHEPGSSKDESDAVAGAISGVTEKAFEDLENMVAGAHEDWANPESTWGDPLRGTSPWDRRANFGVPGVRR